MSLYKQKLNYSCISGLLTFDFLFISLDKSLANPSFSKSKVNYYISTEKNITICETLIMYQCIISVQPPVANACNTNGSTTATIFISFSLYE